MAPAAPATRRAGEDPDLGLVEDGRVGGEGEFGDEEGDGEADSREEGRTENVGSRDAVGEAASAEAEAGEGGHADTDELSRNEPEDDPPGDARTEGVAKRVGRHLDAGVGEGKEGHD